MNYTDAIHYLYSLNAKALPKNLLSYQERPKKLQQALNFPDSHYKTIHVAGTNGKGSVTTKIAAGLQAAGFKTGLYTSPHLISFNERIKINGEMISNDAVARLTSDLIEICSSCKIEPTFFEMATFMAFKYFMEQKVDFAVIETGLGGRFDATNVVNPILTCITSISLDHTELLGKTIAEITLEKAGIIKPHIPIVIGPKVPYELIKPIAIENKSPLNQINETFKNYTEENSAIAISCMKLLTLSNEAILKGAKATPSCRLEVHIYKNKTTVVFDVAHNPDGFLELFKALKTLHLKPIRLIVGFSKGKEIDACLKVLQEQNCPVHFVQANSTRAASIDELKKLSIPFSANFHGSVKDGMKNALEMAELNDECVVVCGSFYIMDEAMQYLVNFT